MAIAVDDFEDRDFTPADALNFIRQHHRGRMIRIQFYIRTSRQYRECVSVEVSAEAMEDFLGREISNRNINTIPLSVSSKFIWLSL